jgi:hypothetical protein
VLPPLTTLLERDAARTRLFKRTKEFAYQAKEYVIETHDTLDQMEKTEFRAHFDSSKVSVQEEVDAIKKIIDNEQ